MSGPTFQRDVFISEVLAAARADKNIIFISADFGAPALDKFREDLPDQFIHSGISEQHMVDMAAGLALSGKKVYIYAMAPFVTLRCFEQIKCSLALMDLPVTIMAVGVGLGYADAGPTHYLTEDIACMRSIVGMEVVSPCDQESTKKIAQMTIEEPSLRVVRMERHALPPVYGGGDFAAAFGFKEIYSGTGVCVLSYGHLLHRVLRVKNKLEENDFGVIDLFRVKPISDQLVSLLAGYQKIITVEEQCLSGGFGGAVLEFLSDNNMLLPVRRLGLAEKYYFENGGRERLLDEAGVADEDIEQAVISFS
ncbi:MAG: 1-deoxy-D-xylulose-5-phosphate synthase [Verrucomicrobia bacterium]|jgi:transketolase|nr:1-deoxy-D-xylulose-5-phosphate synthase [Verrucomicrobiota bacterium]